ncbi:lantibiotic dehydratase [Nonomuraea turcica]|uniref:lantibiotic dehydratase n=1 Tax=Nonomuraea sp. G32 TaxID=3067274 RepID=UPI00273B67CF|nr:lantibiotic dehydratase [Nonomuraea sp. G32]MDP4501996.1 lantibiotic dehydratase [Nonomuraea sp. G32]
MSEHSGHRMPLGATGWSVWREAVLRSTGFPADGLDRLSAPACAAAADALLAGEIGAEVFDKALEQAVHESARELGGIAADPMFREAITWQNRGVLVSLDALVRGGPTQKRDSRRRKRERIVAKYWQRYCAKNETVGFFGPVTWVKCTQDGPTVTAAPGRGLLSDRRVRFEDWALRSYMEVLADDPLIRRSLPPALQPHLTLEGRLIRRPAQPPLPVSAAEAALLSRCDGKRRASDVVADVLGQAGIRTEEDAYLLLERLAERGVLSWRGDVPQSEHAEERLGELLAGIEDPGARERAMASFGRLGAARDRVARSAGDPEALDAALDALSAEFTEITGTAGERRAGQTYAARGLVYEDTTRDVRVTFGESLLEGIAGPLELMLGAARWLTAELAHAYGQALRELFEELRADGPVRLSDLWFLAQGMMFGAGPRPVDAIAEEFARRWSELFGLADVAPGTAELTFTARELSASKTFAAARPGWSAGRLHSPDLQICAESVEAVNRGDYLVVMGEMHAAWATFDCSVLTLAHPDPGALRDALTADIGPRRIRPLYPVDWPRYTGRMSHSLIHPTDWDLGWTAAPGTDPDRLLPAAGMLVTEEGAGLVATASDGRSWPLIEVFSQLVSMHAVDGFKLGGADRHGHSPRITIDRLVVARRTWRTTVDATGLADVEGERARYLAVRGWRQRLGLPDRVFVKLSTEIKPTYVDLTSPVYCDLLCSMVHAARLAAGRDVQLVVSEMLPTPDQAWLPDAAGRRYFTELRMQMVDPLHGGTG